MKPDRRLCWPTMANRLRPLRLWNTTLTALVLCISMTGCGSESESPSSGGAGSSNGVPSSGGQGDVGATVAGGGAAGEDANGAGAPNTVLTEDNVREVLSERACAAFRGCCENRGYAYHPDACEVVEGVLVRAGIFLGELFDADAAQQCVEQIETQLAACQWISAIGPCEQMFSGTAQAGEVCLLHSDCAPVEHANVYCEPPPSDEDGTRVCRVVLRGRPGDACNGSCSGGGGSGYSCTSSGGDPDGLVCWERDGVFCSDESFTCVEYLDEGQACEGGRCADGFQCNADLSPPVCVPREPAANDDLLEVCSGG